MWHPFRGWRRRPVRKALLGQRPSLELLEPRTLLSLNVQPVTAPGATEGNALGKTQLGMVTWDTGTAQDYSATIDWSDGTQSAGAISGNGDGAQLTGDHTYAEEGTYTLHLSVTGQGQTATADDGTITVVDAPLSVTAAPVSAVEGQEFGGVVGVYVDSSDAQADYQATIAWGDGQTSAGVMYGQRVLGTHTYAQYGTYPITLSMTTEDGAAGSATSTATVAGASFTVQSNPILATEGSSFSGVVAVLRSSQLEAANSYMASIAWGDGTTGSGQVVLSGGGTDSDPLEVRVTGNHTYTTAGTHSIATVLTGGTGQSDTGTSTATVVDAPMTVTGTTLQATMASQFTGTLATFNDLGATTGVSYTASVDWGDGQSSTATVSGTTISGSHLYSAAGGITRGITGGITAVE